MNYGDGFKQILEAAKDRRGDSSTDTMIVASHLSQMRTFILRRGLEFYCDQDSYGKRKEFLAKIYSDNMLEMKLDSIVDYFLCDGQGLFYFRPSGDTYQLLYFPKDRYRCYRNQMGEIDNVVLVYSFGVKGKDQLAGMYAQPNSRGGKKKYIKLSVFKDRIEQTVSDEKINFEDENPLATSNMQGQTETLTNSLGFIPAIEVFNHLDCTGESTGRGEFDWLSHQILYHDELVRNIRKNMKFFGNPTLLSSRPKHDIVESGDGENGMRPTISSQAGFRPMSTPNQPFGAPSPIDGQIKVPRVIANLEPTDRVNYLTPDSVSGDQNLYVKQYRSEIRLALGGVDDIDINTAATAYEIKTLYGRVAATAEKKAKAMFEYGLCKLMSMMIQHEEFLFEESFAQAMGLVKPEVPLPENFATPVEYEEAMLAYNEQQVKFLATRDEMFRVKLEAGEIPPGVTGLIPDGNTKVSWRWTGQVFEDDSNDVLQNSIVVRNLQELGVDSIEALKFLFPGKTDEERASMLSGYPFRMVQQTQQSLNQFIGLLGNLYQLPHPQTPNLPLASDPNLDITGFLYRSLEFLRKELSYSGTYKSSSTDDRPTKLSDADRKRAQRGQPTRDERPVSIPGINGPTPGTSGAGGSGLPTDSGSGSSGESMARSISGAERKSDYAQPIPGPGTVLGLPDSNTTGSFPSSLGFASPSSTAPVFGSPDIQSPSFNPGVFGPGSTSPDGAAGGNAKPARRSSRSKRK
tara:strand:+ start:5142 stop:7373 length:2232 start_codon:yes stop_codon:yes gene_type:complete